MNPIDKHHFSQWDRLDAAKAAMQGLLADPEDHEDRVRVYYTDGTFGFAKSNGHLIHANPHYKKEPSHYESCAEAVARLAVEQADCLLAELERTAPSASTGVFINEIQPPGWKGL